MAFKRKVEFTAGSSGTGLLISGLDIDFDINRSVTTSDNTAEFIVYNAKRETRKEILKKNNNVIFKAGYEDEGTGTIFIGNIYESFSVKQDSDWVTTVRAAAIRDESSPIESILLSLSYTGGTSFSILVQQVATALNLSIFGLRNISQRKIVNDFVFSGDARACLKLISRALSSFNVGVYIDNASIVLYNIGTASEEFSALYLTYDSGLLNVSDITEYEEEEGTPEKKRIQFASIMLPKAQPNSLLTIKGTDNDGVYIAEKLRFYGNNYGGDFNIDGEASE
jgi:hypothetical protein